MAVRKPTKQIKLQIPGGQANPAPPVGPALGQCGVNIQEFCTRFNAETKDRMGDTIPVVINVYADRSFDFITKTPPASVLIQKIAKIKKGSSSPLLQKVATISTAQLREIAEKKLPDLNTKNVDQAMKILAGTAKQMGVEIE